MTNFEKELSEAAEAMDRINLDAAFGTGVNPKDCAIVMFFLDEIKSLKVEEDEWRTW